jgi:DNA-binding beta-propeller fold protein YncE
MFHSRVALLALFVCFANGSEGLADLLYISSFGNDRVYQVDATAGATVRTYSAPGFLDSPAGLALSPDQSTLYATGTNASNGDVYSFNTATRAMGTL